MKGRYCPAVFLPAFALLFVSISGFSRDTENSSHSPLKHNKENARQTRPLSADNTYVVRQGDTLSRIARAFETTPAELMAVNKLQNTMIKIGQELRIPVVQTAASPAAPGDLIIAAATFPQGTQDPAAEGNDEPLRQRLVKAGFEWIGVRYRRSGGSEESGFDCSGLVKCLFSKFNIELPRSAREQFKLGEKIDRDKLQAGDLVFFSSSGGKRPTHVGIYIGNDKFLHAAIKAKRVIVSDLNKLWYTMRYLGARRIMDLWWEEPGSDVEQN